MMAKSVDTGDNLGKVCFLNNQIYANFDKSLTESINDRKMEFHKDYLDVHIMLNGVEKIGFYQSPICDQDIELCPFDKTNLSRLRSVKFSLVIFISLKYNETAISVAENAPPI